MQHWNALRDTALATSNQCRRTVSRFTPLIYAIDLRRSSRDLCHTVAATQHRTGNRLKRWVCGRPDSS